MNRWLAAWVFDWLCITAGLALALRAPVFAPAALVLVGSRQHALCVLAHDGAHGSICASRWVNDLLGQLAFLPFGISLNRYRAFHLAHHRWLGTSLDPERGLKARAGTWSLPASHGRIAALCARDLLIWPALREMIPFMGLVSSPLAVLAMIGLGLAALALLGPWTLLLWLIALCTTFWASNRVRIWQEHQAESGGTSRVRAGPLVRFLFLPHNIGFHFEHHSYAAAPFWALPARREWWGSKEPVLEIGELFSEFEKKKKGT